MRHVLGRLHDLRGPLLDLTPSALRGLGHLLPHLARGLIELGAREPEGRGATDERQREDGSSHRRERTRD